MTETVLRHDIRDFAAAVREHLDDLPADEVDDLLDGLEADLSDQADEAGDDFTLPDAAAYAVELRAAAGLPERGEKAVGKLSLRARLDATDAAVSQWVRSNPAIAAVVGFFVSLRPVWWILRAVVLFFVLVPLLGIQGPRRGDLLDHMLMLRHPLAWVLLMGLLVLSIQWGRGKWAPVRWLRIVRTVVSTVVAIIAPFVLTAAFLTLTSIVNASTVQSADVSWTPGLAVDGERVRNIFAYDAEGNPIDQVQLFDQNGQPLTTVGPSGEQEDVDRYFLGGGGPAPVAEREIGRQPVWNVFPLRELAADDAMRVYGDPLSMTPDDTSPPTFPFAEVPSVATEHDTDPSDELTEAIVPTPTESPAP